MAESAKRVKIRRKDLRGPDEFETLTGETLAWAQAHRTPLIVAGAAILAIAVAALLMTRARVARNQEASVQFRQAQGAEPPPRPRHSSRPSSRTRPARRSDASPGCIRATPS
jgi:hypothetical protein